MDLDALLNSEETALTRQVDKSIPVALIDLVTGKAFAVVTPICKMGRDLANDIPLAGDRSLSRFHCQIRQNGSDYYVEDCGSRNGTFLNGSPIAVPRKLQNGDVLSAGVCRYRFTLQAHDSVTEPENPHSGQNDESSGNVGSEDVSENEIQEARVALQKLRGSVDPSSEQDTIDLLTSTNNEFQEKNTESADTSFLKTGSPPVETEEELLRVSQQEAARSPNKEAEDRSKQASSSSNAGSWMDEYVFPELQKLLSEKDRLNGLLEEIRRDIKQIDRKIAGMQGVSQALLSASGSELGQACKQVLETLEWTADYSRTSPHEMSLKEASKVEAVVRIIVSESDPSNKDFEALVSQQAVIWCQTHVEPKGIMIVQLKPELPPRQRPTLSRDFLENMKRKKICVVQPAQLLAIYRLVILNGHDRANFKNVLLTTCGALPGFLMKPHESHAATA